MSEKTITYDDYLEKAYSFYAQSTLNKNIDIKSKDDFEKEEFADEEFMRDLMKNEYADLNEFKDGIYTYPEGHKYRLNIRLDTQTDIKEFEAAIHDVKGSAILVGTDGEEDVQINAKSIIGAIYAMTWNHITIVSDEDIYSKIRKFVI